MKDKKCKDKFECFYEFDLFGKSPEFYYKRRAKKLSIIGRIFTIIYSLIYSAFFIYKLIRMLKRVNVTFYDTFAYIGEIPSINITNENFYGGFAIGNIPFIDETIYYPKAEFCSGQKVGNQWSWSSKEIELEKCKLEKFGSKYRELFKDKQLINLYCLSEVNMTLKGYSTYDQFSYFYLTFYKCNGTTKDGIPCKPSSEIDKYLYSNIVVFYMQDIELTPQIYSSPVQIREKHITGPLYKHLYQKIYTYMQIVITETDNDVIGFEGLSNIKTEKNIKYDESWIISAPNNGQTYDDGYPIFEITVQLAEKVLTQKRSYTKLFEVLGDVGGLMEFFFTFFNIIASSFADTLYNISLINNLFTFDLEKKIILIKNKNNNKNRVSLKERASIYKAKIRPSNFSSKNILNSNDEMIDIKKINTKNNEINSKLSINRKIGIKKKKKKLKNTVTTLEKSVNKISSLNLKNEDNNPNKNSFEYDISNMECREEKDIEKEKVEQKLIKKIKINRLDICFFLLCTKKRKKIEKILIDEGMNIIIKKLDIINIFYNIYNVEKIQEKLNDDEDKITIMSKKSKKDLINIYK